MQPKSLEAKYTPVPRQLMSFTNPNTGKPVKEGAATWRRLIKEGHRVVAGRLLRREHADVEALAIEVMGHP